MLHYVIKLEMYAFPCLVFKMKMNLLCFFEYSSLQNYCYKSFIPGDNHKATFYNIFFLLSVMVQYLSFLYFDTIKYNPVHSISVRVPLILVHICLT